jgi:RNA polymerase sigma factor (sigma-70 family)
MNHLGERWHQLGVHIQVYDGVGQATLHLARQHEFEGTIAMAPEQPGYGLTPPPDSSASLVKAASEGDQVAFARIVAAHHEDMVRVSYVITRDVDAANDAVQEAWSIAWRSLRRLNDPSRLRQWLVAIAANEARQTLRRQRRRVVTELRAEDAHNDDEGTQVWSNRMDLRNALARLSAEDRQLLALRYVAGFDSTELSRVTGLSASGTRARLQRLLATLRSDLEPADG